MTQVVVPDIGDFKDVAVIEVLVKPGDAVAKEQSLITLESDKATMEIPSPSDGVVREIKIKMGDKVSKGSPSLSRVWSPNRNPKRKRSRKQGPAQTGARPRSRCPTSATSRRSKSSRCW